MQLNVDFFSSAEEIRAVHISDMQRLIGLFKRLKQLVKFEFPFELDRQALKVIEMHGFSPEEISMFKDKAVQYFRTGPDLY